MQSNIDVLRLGVSAGLSTLIRRRLLNCLWELTYRCNAKCGICSYWKSPSDPKSEMTLDQIQQGLRKIRAFGCRFINFTGGEPTLRPDLEQIVNSASRLGIWTSMVSNGSLLTRGRIRALKAAGLDNLMLSFDSLDASEHDYHRGIPGLHAKVIERLRWIGEDFLTGHHTGGMMCVLSNRNVHQIAGIVELAERLGVYLVFQPYHEHKTGDASRNSSLDAGAVNRLLALKRNSRALLSSRSYLAGFLAFCRGTAVKGCHAGRKYFSIDPYGYLHPCVDMPAVGHIVQDDISVTRSPQALSAVSACRGCWYCFKGEADSTMARGGYAEKLRLAGSVILRNAFNGNGDRRHSSQAFVPAAVLTAGLRRTA